MKNKLLTLLVASFVSVSIYAADPPVKKSISGICHCWHDSFPKIDQNCMVPQAQNTQNTKRMEISFSESKPSWLVPMIGERDSIMRLEQEMISEQ